MSRLLPPLSLHRGKPTPKARSAPRACGRVPAAAREEVTQPSGKWEGQSERGPCAQPAPHQHTRTRPVNRPIILYGCLSSAGPQRSEHSGPGGRQQLEDPRLTGSQCLWLRGPAVVSRRPDSCTRRFVIGDVLLHSTALRKIPLGFSVASMKAGERLEAKGP